MNDDLFGEQAVPIEPVPAIVLDPCGCKQPAVRLCFFCDRPLCNACTVAESGFAVCQTCKSEAEKDVTK